MKMGYRTLGGVREMYLALLESSGFSVTNTREGWRISLISPTMYISYWFECALLKYMR